MMCTSAQVTNTTLDRLLHTTKGVCGIGCRSINPSYLSFLGAVLKLLFRSLLVLVGYTR